MNFDFYLMDYIMITDEIKPFYDERRKMWRIRQGRETFYDRDNKMIEFETEQEAIEWMAGLQGKLRLQECRRRRLANDELRSN